VIRIAVPAHGPQVAPPIVHDVLGSPGRPLEPAVRGPMEARFGHSFSNVRVHTGERAAASARSVDAAAYTVGRDVVFGADRYEPGTQEGKSLLAHELAHVVQQRGSGHTPGSLPVAPASGELESQAESAAGEVRAGAARPAVQRKVVVNPPAAASQIESHLSTFCGASLTHSPSGELSQVGCGVVKPDEGNDCVCEVVDDAKRTYTINVAKSVVTMKPQKLWDGSTAPVPEASLFPTTTTPAVNPVLKFPDTGSDIELGSFDAKGKPQKAPLWRVLGHELCGHGRRKQTYSGDTGDRAGHDSTIDTENTIATALGEPLRGHYADPRQGESFFNKKGDPKMVFKLKDGLHYEVP
jgi:uncharacterized protein DUF4157